MRIKTEALKGACCINLKACIEMNAAKYDGHFYYVFARIGEGATEYMLFSYCPFCGSKLVGTENE